MEEKKDYGCISTVTITTTEYRELIEEKTKAEYEANMYRHKLYAEQNKVTALERDITNLKQKLEPKVIGWCADEIRVDYPSET